MILNETEKDALVDLVRLTTQKLRNYNGGLRLFCSDDEVLDYFLDGTVTWGSFLPIYLPSDLSAVVYRHQAASENRIFSVNGNPITILERFWHVLAYHSQEDNVRGCFQVRTTQGPKDVNERVLEPPLGKLNVLIGRRKTSVNDTAFNNLFDILAKRRTDTVNLTAPFISVNPSSGLLQRAANFLMRDEKKKRRSVLRYMETALLQHYKPDLEGNFISSLPPNNLRESEAWYQSDFRNTPEPKLADALERVVLRNQVPQLIQRLNTHRVIIVGGFGSGSDFLSRMALLDMASTTQGRGLFRVLQFAGGTNTAGALRDLLSDDLHGRGVGLVLRDLLDPVNANWPLNLDAPEIKRGFLHEWGASLLHDNALREFLSSVRSDPKYQDTRIIVTSQYDTLDELKAALEKREYAGREFTLRQERRVKAAGILNDFSEAEFWNPADDMTLSAMTETTYAVFKAWLTYSANTVPRWLGQKPNQMEQLISLGKIENRYRIAAWCRVWLRLLNDHSNETEFDKVRQVAGEFAEQLRSLRDMLHTETRLGIEVRNTY